MSDFVPQAICRSLIVLQPVLFQYRSNVFEGLNRYLHCYVLSSLKVEPPPFEYVNIASPSPLAWVLEIFKLRTRTSFPRVAFVSAYTTHLGIVCSVLLLWISRIPIIVHGQALFKKPCPSLLDHIISFFWLSISDRYLCYSAIGTHGLFSSEFFRKKVVVALNRFESLKSLGLDGFKPSYSSFNESVSGLRILFIGRDRPGCRLDLAIQLVVNLRKREYKIFLDVIGVDAPPQDGIVFHGLIGPQSIVNIAENCHVGLYPGDAGLSVLHYMALALCPVAHSDISRHSGPEPAYVKDGVTGCLFRRNSLESIESVIVDLYSNPGRLARLRRNAHFRAMSLHAVPFSVEILGAVESVSRNNIQS